ncbi:MAG: hypothetical protein HKO59_10630 [Phycisphaerales bacterium]|nr:hypothetical protein [Phycisphaerae bacterium]NNF43265.1 hypothetical protein [Phycisphaerales bacterium]NNM26418.1 hypothetical protein [Phycisphaerales bacterium]
MIGLLALGLAITILVAWTCALWPSKKHGRRAEDLTAEDWRTAVPEGWPPPRAIVVAWGFGYTEHRTVNMYPHAFKLSRPEQYGERFLYIERRIGWPFRALQCEHYVPAENYPELTPIWRAALSPPARVFGPAVQQRRLPTRPMWLGLIGNTVLYAGVLGVIPMLVTTAQGWRRRRRGLCPQCAYPIGGSPVCTECGKKL